MKVAPNLDTMILFILLVFPGLVSMHIYRILMPAREIDWKHSLVEGLFYSTLNFGLFLPILIPFHRGEFSTNHPIPYIAGMMFVILVGPILWPYLWSKLIRSRKLMKKLQLPYPTAWDYFFDQRKTAFVLVHQKNGKKIGGYYGPNSYATSYPRDGDMFLEAAIRVDDQGKFLNVIDDTMGILIKKDEYSILEFFYAGQNGHAQSEGVVNDRKEPK